jgi:hypothetical protein
LELVVDNPFRVLGLPATATSREISKRVSDLETFAELGKTKKYDADVPALGTIQRTVAAVKEAAQKIEQAESKLFYSFFWFRSGHEDDAKALAALAAGDHCLALATWNAELSKTGRKRYSSRLNRAVLKLWLATQGTSFDRSKFADALEDIGFVVDDHLDESVDEVIGAAAVGLNKEALWKRVVDTLAGIAQAIPGNPYGTNAMALVSHCWTFPPSTLDYIEARLTLPVIERVEAAVEASKLRRESAAEASAVDARRQFKETEMLLVELQLVLGDEDPRFQAVANHFSEELCACAIMAYNKFDDLDVAAKLIEWADRLPSFGRVKARIAENKATFDENSKHRKNLKLIEPFVKVLESQPKSMPDAHTKLDRMKTMLVTLKAKVDASSDVYIKTSSQCAHHILGYAIEVGNAVQATVSKDTIKQIRDVLGTCIALSRELLPMDLDAETRGRVTENLEIMEKVQRQAQTAIASQPSGLAKIPGWLWIVGILVLIAMFK